MNIPFVDLKAQYQSIKKEIDEAIQNVIDETAFIKGKYVQKFEEEYAEVYGVKHAVSCANGTDATGTDDHNPVGDFHGAFERMGDNHDGHVVNLAQAQNQCVEFGRSGRVQAS